MFYVLHLPLLRADSHASAPDMGVSLFWGLAHGFLQDPFRLMEQYLQQIHPNGSYYRL